MARGRTKRKQKRNIGYVILIRGRRQRRQHTTITIIIVRDKVQKWFQILFELMPSIIIIHSIVFTVVPYFICSKRSHPYIHSSSWKLQSQLMFRYLCEPQTVSILSFQRELSLGWLNILFFSFSFCLHCSSENISEQFRNTRRNEKEREGTSGGVWISNVKKSNTFDVKSINAIRYSTKSRQNECIHRYRLMAMNISNEQQDHVDSLCLFRVIVCFCWMLKLFASFHWYLMLGIIRIQRK